MSDLATIGGVIAVVVASAAGFFLAYRAATQVARGKSKEILKKAELARDLLERENESRKKEALLEAKDEALRLKHEADADIRTKRADLSRVEERLAQKDQALEARAEGLTTREQEIASLKGDLSEQMRKLDEIRIEEEQRLERVAGLTAAQAREELLRKVREQAEQEAARQAREIEERAQAESSRKARNIVSLAIAKCAVDQAAESTVSVVPLPSDEMKGRIIGREGRNIRSFETLTGVDLIIDDTPEAVVLSAFDPVRREIARLALTDLVEDGRIHPGRIEESIEAARAKVEEEAQQAAESALLEVGVVGVSTELTKLLGRLKFRTSYGQNCLRHSIEVSLLTGVMASELGLDATMARRAGLLHDIGKAVDCDQDGSHAQIGVDILKKAGESAVVINAVGAHHEDIPAETVEAVLVQASDAISASRPGARRETLETYIKRLQKLETIAESFSGVEKTYAIQAGREIRVMVRPDQITDDEALALARQTAKRIEEEMEYPGQIKVTVIRETRAVDFAN